jgi:glycine/D-amino acid oxidase-like deaminating enzyme
MEEARSDPAFDPGAACSSLAGDVATDVVILGGGYTGMWTAWFLKERDPAVDVVLLEQETCGAGPSGRSGGSATARLRHRPNDDQPTRRELQR